MKEVKNDMRSKYTRETIKKALLKLITAKSINKITVVEVCTTAKVNRATFYNHFDGVYDVYESIENEICDEVLAALSEIKSYDFGKSFFKNIMLLIYRNIDLSVMVISNLNNNSILKRVLNFAHDKYVTEFAERYKKLPQFVVETVFKFNTNGIIGIIGDWVRDGMQQSIDEIASLIDDFNRIMINGVVNKY